ncbi:ralBP1-associated Eps domain-containing protein 2 isoform X4 [Scyliorhinus canicula]|uniref:ralBP1-associated Eps domain-containing protein 2 isoform X4 n=1 Tax=Scyliorhinus canicula TaxID=7830 RepID=UPI0018F37526|nr:ralBP1-associated Eps domain-containing protein 2 isoform X4 [Scyliorhinus canicula]
MSRDCWAPGMVVSEQEERLYSDLFLLTLPAADSTGRVAAGTKVGELFRASQLPPDTLHQITKLCGAKQLGYFGRGQFYLALKLIAAAQSSLPVQLDSINCELPLPHFLALKSDNEVQKGNAPQSAEIHRQLAHVVALVSTPRGTEGVTGKMKQTSVQRADSESQEDLSDYTDDPWRITEEQREYYFNQFKTLQPDTKLLISGSVAKDFFTKSKLPIRELSHIWELSDMDCDGALTLFEFCAAFHLVVARKNGYSLPATLPETLMPEYLQRSEVSPQLTHEDVHLGSHGNLAVESLPVQQQWTNWNDSEENIVAESMPAILPASTLQQPEQHFYNDKPDLNLITNASSKQISGCKELVYTQRRKTRPRSYSSTSAEDAIKKGEVPPTPPPRLPKTHSRASSLDLNKLFQQGTQAVKSGWSQPPPAVPPRPPIAKIAPIPAKAEGSNVSAKQQEKVQQPNFADFSKFSDQASQGSLTDLCPQVKRPSNLGEENSSPVKDTRPRQPPLKPLRRKHRLESQEHLPRLNATSAPDAKLHQQLQKIPSKQKKAIQTAVRKNKEANMILLRLNGELQQQFKEVRKERIALESQLEHFRPVPHT